MPKLILDNGRIFDGVSFGYEGSNVEGEVVFSTNMTGYVESLTDPSFDGQILCLTYPLIGNYGVSGLTEQDEHGVLTKPESSRIWAAGLLITNLSEEYSHFEARSSLQDWLIKSEIPALQCVDTRELVKVLRTEGSMKGKIIIDDNLPILSRVASVPTVSRLKPTTFGAGSLHIALVDCGVKNNIIRSLLQVGFKITVVPHNYDYCHSFFDGIFLSNGPGDPSKCIETIMILRRYINAPRAKPVFGICLGNQILGLAAGCKIKKMTYGNRGFNQPVYMIEEDKTYITSQNHGYAIDSESLPKEWKVIAVNKNDGSNEGIRHCTKPFRSVQFHPEARGGPDDTMFMFRNFYRECLLHRNGCLPKEKILLLGSGGLNIGQAGEFDYSGSQAVETFKEQRYEVVLVNPNVASIQTTDGFADKVYYAPVTPDEVEKIIIKERPDYIALSFGGQTALNCGVELYKKGVLYRNSVKVLGTSIDSIRKTEDRELFSQEMRTIGQETPNSKSASSIEEAKNIANQIGYPILVRAAFALGGLGSGFCKNEIELVQLLTYTFSKSSQVLIDEDLRGWKEVEYEVMRDSIGNSIVVCNMENFDPLGIHTGDSIVVAPSQTLNNDEYNRLRRASLDIAAHLDIVGECNVQIALDPNSTRYKIIEVNPRLSRSSALASKATGYPIAAVAARLCLGTPLHSITNAATGNTTANFEPSLDYIVTKVPKWDTRKFEGVDPRLGSAMKSVGEVMALGRSFEESFQKGLRMATGFGFEPHGKEPTYDEIIEGLRNPTDDRVRLLAYAFYNQSVSIDEIMNLSSIDYWYLSKLDNIRKCHIMLKSQSLDSGLNILSAKRMGFSDDMIARACSCPEKQITKLRITNNILPMYKQIDTLGGEYESFTNYMYSTYWADYNDKLLETEKEYQTVVVVGSGKYRIGSSVEFDYCSFKCAEELRRLGYRTVMINYNPETLSTDFNKNDTLFFEEITCESVVGIYRFVNAMGVIVSMGGQEPNNIALSLEEAGLNILGSSVASINRCEDRSLYSSTLDKIKLDQPAWISAAKLDDVKAFVQDVGFPLVVRPSYVLSGAAMRIVNSQDELDRCIEDAEEVSPAHPVVLTKFIKNAIEVDVDAVGQNGNIVCYAICEHLEKAGVHSGDATLLLPPKSLSKEVKSLLLDKMSSLAWEFSITGPFNTQFLVTDGWIGIIETNLRASRSFPLVSKTYDIPFIKIATQAIMKRSGLDFMPLPDIPYCVVKSPKFSFNRLPGADPKLRIEMASTGEVASWASSHASAFVSNLLASQSNLKWKPLGQNVLLTGRNLIIKNMIVSNGHKVVSPDEFFNWEEIDIVIDVLGNSETREIRRNAIDRSVYLMTEIDQLEMLLEGLGTYQETQPYSEYKDRLYNHRLKLFVRQSFTECSSGGQERLQKALDSLGDLKVKGLFLDIELMNGNKAHNKDTFKSCFENEHGLAFTPDNFRQHRLKTLANSDAMLVFRTGLSESTVFEVAYNAMCGNKLPVFFAVDPGCEIKTTLLRELDGFNNVKHKYKVIEGGVENIASDPDFIEFLSEFN